MTDNQSNVQLEPKQYTAVAINQPPDPFMGTKPRKVQGYYVKHIDTCINPIQPSKEAWDEQHEKHTKHYIFCSGFADRNMPQELEQWEIDPTTLEEVESGNN